MEIGVIDCGQLFRAMEGYDHNGGRYDAAQRVLRRNGWRYDIMFDAWFAPVRAAG